MSEALKISLAPKTVTGYREMLHGHLLPELGSIKLQELRRGTVRDLLLRKHRAGLSKNTVRLIRATLSVLLGDAVDDELLETNVTVGGRRGRRRAETMNAADRVKAIKPMSLEQLATLLAVADASSSRRDAMLFLTLADAGLRPSEALALTWEDFDVVDRTVRIERAVSGGRIKPTKTEEARNVDLTPRLAGARSVAPDLRWNATTERAAGRPAVPQAPHGRCAPAFPAL